MSINNLTFKLYSDSDLTIPSTNTLSLIHNSDLSDNPQDFVFYFGSTTANRKLQTKNNPGTDDITITPVEILKSWSAGLDVTVGDIIVPTSANDNDRKYRCTAAGKTSTTEPSWTTVSSNVYNDGSDVKWEYAGVAHQKSEIKLASTNAGLASATAGAPLSLGTEILAAKANAKQIHIRITNTVTEIGSNAAAPNLALSLNAVVETNG